MDSIRSRRMTNQEKLFLYATARVLTTIVARLTRLDVVKYDDELVSELRQMQDTLNKLDRG